VAPDVADRRFTVRDSNRSVYDRAMARVRELLRDGTFRPGTRLPAESELGPMLGISRPTLREVLRALSNEGLIIQRQGVGTFVAEPRPIVDEGLEELESFDSLAARHGWQCGTEHVSFHRRLADDITADLGVPADAPMTEVRRVRTADGRAAAYMCDYVPESVLPARELEEHFAGSVLDLILARGAPRVEYCSSTLTAVVADGELASLLSVRPGSPLLLVDETLHGVDGEPFEYSKTWFATDLVRLHLIRRVKQRADRTA